MNTARVGDLDRGTPFRTLLTRRYGVVLAKAYNGKPRVQVELESSCDQLTVLEIHPGVIVALLSSVQR